MKLNKKQSFFAILAVVVVLCLLYQSVWIFSRTTMAEVTGTETVHSRRGKIYVIDASYTVGYEKYSGVYLKNGWDGQSGPFQVRYLIFAPGISRSNSFVSNWGPLLMVFLIAVLVASIAFLRKDIISDQAVFIVQRSRPFIRIENNEVVDYDTHYKDYQPLSQTEESLKEKLRTEQIQSAEEEIRASVYKFNPNAIAIFIVYLVFLIWVLHSLFFTTFGYSEIIISGLILLFVPLYIQNTNNKIFKMKILDETKLAFLTDGIRYEEVLYSTDQIEAAVVYLESFDGFTYRDQTTFGKIKTVSAGDNNKISFRYNGEISDLTFYLANFTDFCAFRNLLAAWSAKGVNVLLQKVFEDDFLVQEMVRFGPADK